MKIVHNGLNEHQDKKSHGENVQLLVSFEVVLTKNVKIKISHGVTESGRKIFCFEEVTRKQRILLGSELFDSFRRAVERVSQPFNPASSIATSAPSHTYLSFGGKLRMKLEYDSVQAGERVLHITDLERSESSDRLVLPERAVGDFFKLLFDARLDHPSGCLDRVSTYHQMLQLAFPNVSESMNAEMKHRSGFLCFEIKNPSVLPPVLERHDSGASEKGQHAQTQHENRKLGSGVSLDKPKDFKSRLGIRNKGVSTVSYDDFLAKFSSFSHAINGKDKPEKDSQKKEIESGILDLGLSALKIKSLTESTIRIRPDEDDLLALRDHVSENKENWDFYLGFEIVDLWFTDRNKKLRCFRFPLYFCNVTLSDFGAEIEVRMAKNRSFYLNFLALTTIIEKFSRNQVSDASLEKALQRILHAKFDWHGSTERATVERSFPVSERFFREQRRVLFGQESSGPLGGIFEDLKIEHFSVDPDQTLFFARREVLLPPAKALAKDLESVQKRSHELPAQFLGTLLGRIFSPSVNAHKDVQEALLKENDAQNLPLFNPFELPEANERLFNEIARRDVMLVEGPPGTGKTFSMLGLLVHYVCMGKSVLVVSDKQSALDALYEKIVDFTAESPRDDVDVSLREFALLNGIKDVRLSEKNTETAQNLARHLKNQLRTDLLQKKIPRMLQESVLSYAEKLRSIDQSLRESRVAIDRLLAAYFNRSSRLERLCPRNWRETTADEIADFAEFTRYFVTSPDVKSEDLFRIIKNFTLGRQKILVPLYPILIDEFCPVDYRLWSSHVKKLEQVKVTLQLILEKKPRSEEVLLKLIEELLATTWHGFLIQLFRVAFGAEEAGIASQRSSLTRIKDRIFYPLAEDIQNLFMLVSEELEFYALAGLVRKRSVSQMKKVHLFLCSLNEQEYCLAWNVIGVFIFGEKSLLDSKVDSPFSIHIFEILERIRTLRTERTQLVRECFVNQLTQPAKRLEKTMNPESLGHDVFAVFDSMFEAVIQSDSETLAWENLEKVKQPLAAAYQVWLVRKDLVSLVLPNLSQSIDLVIIDEATQCRVDDAVPLFSRAKKIVAVGDDRQTVLHRRSVLDDYLFEDLELENHLQVLGAVGMKSGGSHVFSLVKGLKQGRVLLDEHYRCPPDIIEFSNRFVYEDQLKVMKWKPLGEANSVVVDYSERRTRLRNRPTSGKYKGIELGMIDRFFHFVENSILDFEKQIGRKVNLESDVAICYFLLKNSEYVKEQKAKFLLKMKRGGDVLDGAGAALQGKERDLVFFLWDMTRANFQAFLQGDDPLKRKGELNVLMSRPRLRAYHYLHKDFQTLTHSKSSIASYLWDVYTRKDSDLSHTVRDHDPEKTTFGFDLRSQRPLRTQLPWRRTDGQLLYSVLKVFCESHGFAKALSQFVPQFGVVIGMPDRRVDLILIPKSDRSRLPRIAFIEISGFEGQPDAESVSDYFSLLTRAKPDLSPIFLNIFELYMNDFSLLAKIFAHIAPSTSELQDWNRKRVLHQPS